jgi:hypothetical protein
MGVCIYIMAFLFRGFTSCSFIGHLFFFSFNGFSIVQWAIVVQWGSVFFLNAGGGSLLQQVVVCTVGNLLLWGFVLFQGTIVVQGISFFFRVCLGE